MLGVVLAEVGVGKLLFGVDVDRRSGYTVGEFWEPIRARPDRSLILDPGEFYILASKEAVQVPPDFAAESEFQPPRTGGDMPSFECHRQRRGLHLLAVRRATLR